MLGNARGNKNKYPFGVEKMGLGGSNTPFTPRLFLRACALHEVFNTTASSSLSRNSRGYSLFPLKNYSAIPQKLLTVKILGHLHFTVKM